MLTEEQSMKIKIAMIEEKITVTALAEELGIARTMLSGVISGSRQNKRLEEQLKERYLGVNYGRN